MMMIINSGLLTAVDTEEINDDDDAQDAPGS